MIRRSVVAPIWVAVLIVVAVILISGATGVHLGKRVAQPFTVAAASDINGTPVIDGRELELTVSRMSPGSMIKLEIFRAGQRKQVTVTLGQAPATQSAAH
jgi:hypothetical protein